MTTPLDLGKSIAFRLLSLWLKCSAPRRRKRICVFKPDGIGDFVLSSQAIYQLVAHHGPEAVCLVVAQQVASLAKKIFPGVEVLSIVPGHAPLREKISGLLSLRLAIRTNTYEEVVCLRHYRTAYEDIILNALAANRVNLLHNQSRVADGNTSLRPPSKFFYSCPISSTQECSDNLPREWSFHSRVLSLSLARHVTAASMRPNWDSCGLSRENSDAFVLIAPLAGNRIRDLPIKLVGAAIMRSAAGGLHRLIVTGSRAQAEQLAPYVQSIAASLPSCRVEVVHPDDLPALVSLISKARLVLSAESSPAHIAVALDKPTLILIGGGHYGWFAPWYRSAKQIWLTNHLACFDCNWQCPYLEPFCLTGITSEQVQTALATILAQAAGSDAQAQAC